MNIAKAQKLLRTCIQANLPVLLVGAPGVGKTDIVCQAAQGEGYDLIVSHPVVSDPTDAKGLPYPSEDGLTARFLPYGDLARALNATRPTIWFLDDLGQATPAVQAAFMQLLLARRIGEHQLPDCITFVAATNRKADRAGVSGILEPVKSRFVTIISVTPSVEDWTDWALDNGLPGELIAFLRYRPDLLFQPAPTLEIVNSPSSRTWANAARLMQAGLDPDIEQEALCGSVGETGATELVSFLNVWRELPSPDSVLLDPLHASIPDSPSVLYALSSALASYANKENFNRVVQYAERLNEAGKGEIAAHLLRDSTRRNAELTGTAAYVEAISGPLGELFN